MRALRRPAVATGLPVALLAYLFAAGCAHLPWSKPPADGASPAPPHTVLVPKKPEPEKPTTPVAETPPPEPPAKVEGVMSEEEKRATLVRIREDTTAVSAALRRCRGKNLLPDQENAFDATSSLLDETRAALLRQELWHAESLARKARQLASSLTCQ